MSETFTSSRTMSPNPLSVYYVVLHYQKGDCSQAKLVRVIKGKVLDVAVDLSQSSPTFGKVCQCGAK